MGSYKKIELEHSVVVVGSMNPAIHHPAWYCRHKLITEDEQRIAIEDKTNELILTNKLAQFSTDVLTVFCQENRWQIKTRSDEQFNRIGALAGAVFDDLLLHTPVSRFGVNIHFAYQLSIENVGARLVEIIRGTNLPLPGTNTIAASIKCGDLRSDHSLNTQIEPAGKPPNVLNVSFNADYQIEATGHSTPFSLGEILTRIRTQFRKECETAGNGIAQFTAG